MEQEEYTTIQIYRKDLKLLTDDCKKNENLRDKIHEVINFHYKLKKEAQKNGKNN